jgi:hypothetical protein
VLLGAEAVGKSSLVCCCWLDWCCLATRKRFIPLCRGDDGIDDDGIADGIGV